MTKILVIDDDADIRYTISEICRFGGWEPLVAANGQEGLEIFRLNRPELVMVDYHMPVKDGINTVREIRELDGWVPILVLTVDERQEVADNFLDQGATDFALKPIKAPDLIARIRINLQIGRLQRQKQQQQEEVFVTKGISASTLTIIEDYLKAQKEALTIEEITKQVSLAYQTVHRYLLYLVEEGKVVIECDYGKVGRPRNRYKWNR
ncbi:MAG: response regulator [Clostridia bacterium]|nr:response regulator [Clostridia bacterium]